MQRSANYATIDKDFRMLLNQSAESVITVPKTFTTTFRPSATICQLRRHVAELLTRKSAASFTALHTNSELFCIEFAPPLEKETRRLGWVSHGLKLQVRGKCDLRNQYS